MQDVTEHQLVLEARKGSADAFRELVVRYEPRVTALCQRILESRADAEDAAISAFVKAWKGLGRYDTARPFSTWLLTIASREAVSVARARKLWTPLDEVEERGGAPHAQYGSDPEDQAVAGEQTRTMLAALARLDPPYRAALVLRYQLDLSYEEIAGVMKVPPGTVATLVHRGKKYLRKHLEEVEA